MPKDYYTEEIAVPERKASPFMSLLPTRKQAKDLNVLGYAKGMGGRALGNVIAGLQREESTVAAGLEEAMQDPALAAQILSTVVSPATGIRGITELAGRPRVQEAFKGERVEELGDIYRRRGVAEPASKVLGLGLSAGLPTSIAAGEAISGIGKEKIRRVIPGLEGIGEVVERVPKTTVPKPGPVARFGAQVAGVEQETLEDVAKIGYRKVLQKKFYGKKIPRILQERIERNIDDLHQAASTQFDDVTKVSRTVPLDDATVKSQLKKELVGKRFIKDTPEDRLLQKVLDVIDDPEIKFNDMGDLLDFRRELDTLIYTEKSLQRTGTSKIKQIRDATRDLLHTDDIIKKADADWFELQQVLRDTKKITGDTGENILGRFGKMTDKQKKRLIMLEKHIGGEPFVEDLTKHALAKEFVPRARPAAYISSVAEKIIAPMYRGGLRTGGAIRPVTELGKKVGPFMARPAAGRIEKPERDFYSEEIGI